MPVCTAQIPHLLPGIEPRLPWWEVGN